MNVLIVDQSKRSMQIVRRFLASVIPDVAVSEYDTEQRGVPPHTFNWAEYDVLVLNQELGVTGTGIKWLGHYGASPNFPTVIIITAKDDPQTTAEALKAGAHTVISKRDLTPDLISRAVRDAEAVDAPSPTVTGVASGSKHTDSDLDIVKQARGGGDGFKFMRLIGQGAMSRVYLAQRLEDQQTVVLKIMDGTLSSDARSVKRFILEASLVSELDSRHVVKVYEQGFTNKYGFMSMEFFSRGDLKQRIEHGISAKNSLIYMWHIAKGLQVIHDVGIIHRDLKPANIMFRGDDQLAIADFGISKHVDSTTQLTAVGSILGTPYYMSPEQIRTEGVDHRADLYSAGIILYEMLTGRKPFEAESLTGIVLKHLQEEADPLPDEVSRFESIFRRLVAKEPEARFQHASELVQALNKLAQAWKESA